MIEPTRLIEHLDTLAPPVTLAEIQHAERTSRMRLVTVSAVVLVIAVLVAAAWLGRDDAVEQQPAETPAPDVEVTTPTTLATEITFGPAPDFVPFTPPLADWELTSFRSGVDENQQIIPASRYATVNETGDGYASTLRVWTAPTAEFTVARFAESEEEFRLADGRTAWRSDLGGTSVRIEIDEQRSLLVQGQGLDTAQVAAALVGVEFIDDIPVVADAALPVGMQRLEGSTFGNRTTSTTWTRGERNVRLTQIDGPGARLSWRRCCNLANRWSLDPGAVDIVSGFWTRQIDEDTVVSTASSDMSETETRDFFDRLTRPSADRWLVELESQLLGDVGEGRLLDPGPLSSRGSALVAAVDSKVIVWGGRFAGIDRTDGAVYDIATGSWSPVAPHPAPPADASIAVLDDRVVIFGGTIDGEPTTAAAIYDPATDRWTTVAPFATDGAIGGALVRRGDLLARASNGFGHRFATLDPDDAEWSVLPDPPAIALGVESGAVEVSESGRWLAYTGTAPFSEVNGGSQRVLIFDLDSRVWGKHDVPALSTFGNIGPGDTWLGDELALAWQTASFGNADRSTISLVLLDPATGLWSDVQEIATGTECFFPELQADGADFLVDCRRSGNSFRLQAGANTWEIDPDAEPRFVPRPDSLRTLAEASAGPFTYLGGDGVPNTFVRRSGPDDG